MTTIIQLTLSVGDPLTLADADAVTAVAQEAGVTTIRLADDGNLDPTVTAGYLAGRHHGIGFIAEVPTTHQAPYNTARRILSLDRASGGRTGIALRPGDGDEVSGGVVVGLAGRRAGEVAEDSDAGPAARWAGEGGGQVVVDRAARWAGECGGQAFVGRAARWTEYAHVLSRLWASFPRVALIGDQAAGLVVDDELIRAINHNGESYRVAGPIDGPSSVQGRPVIVADLTDELPFAAAAEYADVIVIDRATQVDQHISGVALLGRVWIDADADADADAAPVGPTAPAGLVALAGELRAWALEQRLDGFELVPRGDPDPEDLAAVLKTLVPLLANASPPGAAAASGTTLRAALALA
ncbi:LLM class flavin-dependent oxidoreductase [Winogradskya humida]|uniref:Alkanesulfonate monooxygenase SsuD/methylene tetrahydromethanopterin reductase-like flavin-dependent oxidoreductase (Luciferase family) n=1 Tax=Winogradskya humida TaxID=113566 RepID=A0ABQ4A3N0_9ACTN|nr:LLM class flavin-dependent oxidoreductase [Actinoplanes humidus]GIE25444.1 hypothetical protein Ahu01nite_085460 [Actinoplanes humidus]